jgi:hypothetical protein
MSVEDKKYVLILDTMNHKPLMFLYPLVKLSSSELELMRGSSFCHGNDYQKFGVTFDDGYYPFYYFSPPSEEVEYRDHALVRSYLPLNEVVIDKRRFPINLKDVILVENGVIQNDYQVVEVFTFKS